MTAFGETARSELVEWAVATRARAGERESGDRYVVQPFPGGVLIAAVDGLGHGEEAAAAADNAARLLAGQADESVITLVRQCHAGLADTRGAVMSLASFNARDGTITWLGVGNVEGVLLRADGGALPQRESLLRRGGVVGYQLPPLSAWVIPVSSGDTLLFATDGVRPSFADRLSSRESPQRLADRLLAEYGEATDDALVLVVRFVGPP